MTKRSIPEEPLFAPDTEDIGFWLKTLSNSMEWQRNHNMAAYELTSSQFEVLLFLIKNDKEEVNQIDIEKAMKRSNPTITGIVKRLEAKEFIKRLPSEKDKRYKKLVVTEKGYKYFQDAEDERTRNEDALLQGLTQEDRERLLGYIKRMNSNVKNMKED